MNLHEKFKRTKKRLNQRGQVLALYVIAFPILLIFVCVGFDMGWYYLNLSRLQNAAEAAAIAGANKLAINDISNVKKILLVNNPAYDGDPDELNIDNANAAATDYANKNLFSSLAESGDIDENTSQDTTETSKTQTDTKEEIYNNSPIKNSLTKEPVKLVTKDNKAKEDKYVTTSYKDINNDHFYQVVLQEDVEHFMMPGWFPAMPAEVYAVAKLSVSGNDEAPVHVTTPEVGEEEQEVLEKVKNENVIVGNWEVQKYYKDITNTTRHNEYIDKFDHDVYVKAWNHFKDESNHHNIYEAPYRIETIIVKDQSPDNKISEASANKLNPKSYTYNPTKNPNNSNDNRVYGDRYSWQLLDSINIDTVPDVTFNKDELPKNDKDNYTAIWQLHKNDKGEYIIDWDWDLQYGYLYHTTYTHNTWDNSKKGTLTNRGNLRIHTSINMEDPYPVRSSLPDDYYKNLGYEDEPDRAYPDVLWARIESEPMINYWNAGLKVFGLNSVRQFILNFNQSNTATDTDGKYIYRPVIFFYDGPEKNEPDNPLRDSKPVIVNMNAPFRGVLYAPNSPVVVVGKSKNEFQGFIVAKEYKRLKTTADFKAEPDKYTEYTQGDKYYFEEKVAVENPYYVADEAHYYNYSKEPEMIKWKYTKIIEDGIEMYVDNYGNVQYMPYPNAPQKIGVYDNFGRTDFTTHGYSVAKESLFNMLTLEE